MIRLITIQFVFTWLIVFDPTLGHGSAAPYGAYGLYPQGSTRVTAMGGAFTGLSDDSSGMNTNPAGISMGKGFGTLNANYSTVYNQESDVNGSGQRIGVPYNYLQYSGSIHLENWSFGLGLSSPYTADLTFTSPSNTREIILAISSVDIPLAYRINKNFGVGVALHLVTVQERYKFTTSNSAVSNVDMGTEKGLADFTAGAVYRSDDDNWGLGLALQAQRDFKIDEGLNQQTDGVNWFRSVRTPAKTTVGYFHKILPALLATVDLDYFSRPGNAVYVGSELTTQFRRVEVEDIDQWVLHGGLEWNFISTEKWDTYLRAGAYEEPARLKGGNSRGHLTGGFEVRYWLVTFSGSVDSAPDFNNSSGGLGLTLKSVF